MKTKSAVNVGRFIPIPGRSYEMGETPITEENWASIMGNQFDGAKRYHPKTNISWNDCHEFCAKLNAIDDGYVYRLPTEAEWEHAARAGTTGDYWFPASEIRDHAWCHENSGKGTHPVNAPGHANPWGLSDILGHVWEWCEDLYEPAGSRRGGRGGSWGSGAGSLRSSCRNGGGPGYRWSCLGARLVRTAVDEQKEKNRVRHLTKKIVSLVGASCSKCGETENLHRHHPVYEPDNFVILCACCHLELHNEHGTWGRGKNNKTCYVCGKKWTAKHQTSNKTCSRECGKEASRLASIKRWADKRAK